MMNAIIFTRVSSAGQEDGVSLDAQEAKLKEYCAEKSLKVLQSIRAVESSTKGERKCFKEALDFISKQKTPTVLLVHSIDRLLRGFKEYGMIEALIESGKMEVHAYNERLVINKNTSWADLLQFDFTVIAAKIYVGQLTQHIKKARDYKLSQGEVIGHVPTGYLNYRDPLTKKATVIIDDQRAFVVKRLFQEYSTGAYTLSEITAKAKQWGLTAPRTKKPHSKSSIAKMIKNPFYIGQMLVKGQLYPHVYTVLIDATVFERCQKVGLAASPKTEAPEAVDQRAKKPFIFRGLIRCAHCGCQISSDIKKGRYIYLFCSKAKGKDICQAKRIREEKALEVVENVLSHIQVPEPLIKAIHERLKAQYNVEQADIKAMASQLQKRFNEIDPKLDRLLNLFLDGSITEETYDKKRHELQQDKQDSARQLADLTDGGIEFQESFVTLLKVVSNADKVFKSSKVDQKRKILRFVFSNLSLEGENIHYELNKPFDKLVTMGGCQDWWSIGDSNS